MEYEDLDITQLAVGSSVAGFYRGEKKHLVPAFGDQPETVLARVFLEAAGGPVAVQVDEPAIAQIGELGVNDGHRILVTRTTEGDYLVARELGETQPS
jgi:hypothetical protein